MGVVPMLMSPEWTKQLYIEALVDIFVEPDDL